MSKPSEDHYFRRNLVPIREQKSKTKVSEEYKEKVRTRRSIEDVLEKRRIEREMSLDYEF